MNTAGVGPCMGEACVALSRGAEGEGLAKVYGWRSDFINEPAQLCGRMAGFYTHTGFPAALCHCCRTVGY